MVSNLRRAQQKWALLTMVLGREGTDARTSGSIYVVVVQAVLMYGSDTWVMTLRIGSTLGGLYHRVARRLKGRKPWRGVDGSWVYPPLAESM